MPGPVRAQRNSGSPERGRGSLRSLTQRTAFWVALVDLALILIFGFWSENHVFLTVENFRGMALDGSELALLAIGSAFLLGAGRFDISLGANVILSSVVGARVLIWLSGGSALAVEGRFPHLTLGVIGSVLACLIVGTGIGIINGVVVSGLGINTFVATLGMLGVATGVAGLISGGTDISNLPTGIQEKFGTNQIFGIPEPVLITFCLLLILWFVLARRRFGLRTLAIGSSRDAALRAGIPVIRHEIKLFALAGFLAGVAAFIDLTRFDTTNIGGHQTDALAAIAAAVIGGASLEGGRASVIGAAIGTALAVILQVGLIIVGFSAFYQVIAIGVILVTAVYIDQRRRRLP